MRTSTQIAFLQLVETLVRAVVILVLGFTGLFAVLTAFYHVGSVNFSLFSGPGVIFLASLITGGSLLWFSRKLLKSLVKRAPTA